VRNPVAGRSRFKGNLAGVAHGQTSREAGLRIASQGPHRQASLRARLSAKLLPQQVVLSDAKGSCDWSRPPALPMVAEAVFPSTDSGESARRPPRPPKKTNPRRDFFRGGGRDGECQGSSISNRCGQRLAHG